MPLTDTTCKKAVCPPDKARVRLTDSGGLYLEVVPSGSKLWRWKYRFEGAERRMALGAYPGVSIAAARAARDDAREVLNRGVDPVVDRQVRSIGQVFDTAKAAIAVAVAASKMTGEISQLPPPPGPGWSMKLVVNAPPGWRIKATRRADGGGVDIELISKGQ